MGCGPMGCGQVGLVGSMHWIDLCEEVLGLQQVFDATLDA